jgi:hypothetical protein
VPRIFIVHGLYGGATKTWQHPESGVIWFRDLLPDLIRTEGLGANARIWTYGYPANVTFQTQTIYDYAQGLLSRVKDARKGHEVRMLSVGMGRRSSNGQEEQEDYMDMPLVGRTRAQTGRSRRPPAPDDRQSISLTLVGPD